MAVRLYILSGTPNSVAAEANLSRAVAELGTGLAVEIIDVIKDPSKALGDGVLVTPTLIAGRPPGAIRMIGRLEPVERVVQFLAILSKKAEGDDSAARSAQDSSARR